MKKYSLEKAQEEANKMQSKVESSEAENYSKAEELVEKETKEINNAQNKWDSVKHEIENTYDAEGYGIDEGIKEPVIALNAFEINTGQSCEGCTESGMSAPWIRIEASNEPEERFVGQNNAFEKVAKKYNMPVEEAKRMFNMDAYWEAIHECDVNGETEEFKKYKEESEKLLYTTKEILNDFYKNHQVPDNLKIRTDTENVENMTEGSFEIFNGGDDYKNINGIKLSEEEKESLNKRLGGYRKEMQAFAEFLKEKFFSDGENYINEKRSKAQEKIDRDRIKEVREKI